MPPRRGWESYGVGFYKDFAPSGAAASHNAVVEFNCVIHGPNGPVRRITGVLEMAHERYAN